MRLSNNFSLEEFTKSKTADSLNILNVPALVHITNLQHLCTSVLQPIRDKWNKPIFISGGYRCRALNKAVGGVPTSQHLLGEAADLICEDNKSLWYLIKSMIENGEIKVGQLIDEKNLSWIHISLPSENKCNQIFKIQ